MKLGIITNKNYASCETFIKAQIDHLPFDIAHYYGASLPLSREGGGITKASNLFSRVYNRFIDSKASLKRTIQMLKDDGIEVVFAEYGMVGAMMTEACEQLDIPMIVHFHGHDAVRNSVVSEYGESYLKMFAYASKIISVSHVMTTKLIALGCPAEKIIYNTYGPNDKFLAIEPRYSKKQLVAIGRFVEKKAPHLLILAFKKVLEKHPDVKLIMAGDGPLWSSSKDLAMDLEIEDRIDFPGVVIPDTFIDYLAESLIFVQHSVTAPDGDMEGTPVAILEASGAGLPVVSTLHAGIPDVIIDGETGLLVEEKDVHAMAEKIIELLNDIDLIKEMGKKGKENITQNFSFTRHIDGLIDVTQSVYQA